MNIRKLKEELARLEAASDNEIDDYTQIIVESAESSEQFEIAEVIRNDYVVVLVVS